MTELVAFLAARLDEDEAIANRAARKRRGPWRILGDALRAVVFGSRGPDLPVADTPGTAIAEHIARHDPARVLGEVTAKRAILQAYESQARSQYPNEPAVEELRDVLQTLASVYVDHPDYGPAWD